MLQSLLTLTVLLVSENITYARPVEAQYVPIVRSAPPEPQNDPVEPTSTPEAPKVGVRWNCYLFVKSLVPDLPFSKDLVPNKTIKNTQEGSVALFTYYRGTSKEIKHYAFVSKIISGGFIASECNYKAGVCGDRFISFDDPNLDGYWFPASPL